MRDIVVYGAGGHCYAVIELLKCIGEFSPVLIVDDAPKEKSILGVPVFHTSKVDITTQYACIAIGNNLNRKKVAQRLTQSFPSSVHPSAVIYPSSTMGIGTLVHPKAVVDAAVSVGDFCIINNGAVVSHNAKVGNHVHIAIQAAVSGGVTIGEGSLIGAGSIILPEISIGKWVTVGAGAVVTKDIPDHAIVYGNPARIIKYTNES
ncbi:acetyltransferase [Altibacter lentus]|uniref:acetyltransferase n=1 Tax=Altibacter lentus TaxID=1223410 RepID=UPI00068D9BC7|nr:acetyltransferase [Altibacter lentus]